MSLFEQLVPQLRRDEGWVLRAYKDSLGILTIGCGHNLTVPISNEAVRQILRDDVAVVMTALEGREWFQALSEPRQGVLVNMAFNLGLEGMLAFTKMLAAVRMGDWEQAARDMLDSTWALQVGARANRLAQQMREDRWV